MRQPPAADFVTLLVIVLVGRFTQPPDSSPRLIERQLAALVEERLGQKLTVEKLKSIRLR